MSQLPIPLQLFKEFRDAYRKASDAGDEQFVFHGHEVLTQYAKYVVEYEEPLAIKAGYIRK